MSEPVADVETIRAAIRSLRALRVVSSHVDLQLARDEYDAQSAALDALVSERERLQQRVQELEQELGRSRLGTAAGSGEGKRE